MSLQKYLADARGVVDDALQNWLPPEGEPPATLHRAMRYSVFAGGKRLRPALAIAAFQASGGQEPDPVLPAACALECIHTFTLIHDDLPCMDDDDYRRGVQTCHRVFGEAMALLAGDGLFAEAVRIALLSPLPPERVIILMNTLFGSLGGTGVIGGQVADLEAEGREEVTKEMVAHIHSRKTGALIGASVAAGAVCAGEPPERVEKVKVMGQVLGLAFQIADDLLDETGELAHLGKSAGKDSARGKATMVRAAGLGGAGEEAEKSARQAVAMIEELYSERGERLKELARFAVERSS